MPANHIPLVNGKAYAWANVSFLIDGVPEVGVTAINYDDTTEKVNGRGTGKYPIDRADGNYEATASVTLKASAIEAIAAVSPGGRIQDYGMFDIIVQFLVGTVRKRHIIRNCEFTKNGRAMSQGDTQIEMELPLICSHIEWI